MVFSVWNSCLPELVFIPDFLIIMVEVNSSGPPHVLELSFFVFFFIYYYFIQIIRLSSH